MTQILLAFSRTRVEGGRSLATSSDLEIPQHYDDVTGVGLVAGSLSRRKSGSGRPAHQATRCPCHATEASRRQRRERDVPTERRAPACNESFRNRIPWLVAPAKTTKGLLLLLFACL